MMQRNDLKQLARALASVETFSGVAAQLVSKGPGDDEWLINLRLVVGAASANMTVAKALTDWYYRELSAQN